MHKLHFLRLQFNLDLEFPTFRPFSTHSSSCSNIVITIALHIAKMILYSIFNNMVLVVTKSRPFCSEKNSQLK